MKSFYKFLEAMDTGLRGELETSFGSSSYDADQESAVSNVVNLVMQAASTDLSRLMTMLRTLSSRDPSMKAIYDQIDVNKLRAAARKHTGDNTGVSDSESGPMDSDNVIKKPGMDSEFSAP
jgi:hypothetical protein